MLYSKWTPLLSRSLHSVTHLAFSAPLKKCLSDSGNAFPQYKNVMALTVARNQLSNSLKHLVGQCISNHLCKSNISNTKNKVEVLVRVDSMIIGRKKQMW
ncbi:hypothetical protein COE51_01065 [Bacillus pseudomycoides]|nr:hypothetical protein COE51_01065 [Bacillus pseudomycoides]